MGRSKSANMLLLDYLGEKGVPAVSVATEVIGGKECRVVGLEDVSAEILRKVPLTWEGLRVVVEHSGRIIPAEELA